MHPWEYLLGTTMTFPQGGWGEVLKAFLILTRSQKHKPHCWFINKLIPSFGSIRTAVGMKPKQFRTAISGRYNVIWRLNIKAIQKGSYSITAHTFISSKQWESTKNNSLQIKWAMPRGNVISDKYPKTPSHPCLGVGGHSRVWCFS